MIIMKMIAMMIMRKLHINGKMQQLQVLLVMILMVEVIRIIKEKKQDNIILHKDQVYFIRHNNAVYDLKNGDNENKNQYNQLFNLKPILKDEKIKGKNITIKIFCQRP